MLDFTGKTVLVTGGGAGIGGACAHAFADAGADVVIAEIDPERCAAFTKGRAVQCDVTKPEEVKAVAASLERLDILVNNVGHYVHAKPFSDLSDDEADEILTINLRQLFSVTRAMIPLLRKSAPGSAIINITSIEAFRGIPTCSIYAACKAGVAGFTKSLALELAPDGIRVNDIAPETTDTPQTPIQYMIPEENRHNIERWIPLGRFGKPEDCAGAALYLASDLASWVTGSTIHVDGGALAAAGWTRDPKGIWTNMPIVTGNGMNL